MPRWEDHLAYERALLGYMLTVRTKDPPHIHVVWSDTLLREFVDDLSGACTLFNTTPEDLRKWALKKSEWPGSEPQRLSCHITQSYRVMVGAFSYGYHPDWLCVPPSPLLGNIRFPAWDRWGNKIV